MRRVTITLVGSSEDCSNLVDFVLQKFGENELQIDVEEDKDSFFDNYRVSDILRDK